MRLPTLPREAGLWVAAACTGLAGGLAYKHWATKKYGGEANRLVAEAKRAAVAGDASTACARYEECLELVRTRGGAHQRFGEATATLARAAANACEDAGERRRAEALWHSALESSPPRHRSRAVAYDRLASLAQDRGAVQEALALRAKAVGALATPTQIAEASLDPAVAYELAGVMHNYATLFCEAGDTSAATKTLDQTHRVCGVVPDATEQDECRRRCDALRRHIVKEVG